MYTVAQVEQKNRMRRGSSRRATGEPCLRGLDESERFGIMPFYVAMKIMRTMIEFHYIQAGCIDGIECRGEVLRFPVRLT